MSFIFPTSVETHHPTSCPFAAGASDSHTPQRQPSPRAAPLRTQEPLFSRAVTREQTSAWERAQRGSSALAMSTSGTRNFLYNLEVTNSASHNREDGKVSTKKTSHPPGQGGEQVGWGMQEEGEEIGGREQEETQRQVCCQVAGCRR